MARDHVLFERRSLSHDDQPTNGESSVPLLRGASSSQRARPRDVRFAISEDDVEAPSDADDDDDDDQRPSGSARYGQREDTDPSQHTKYPPPNALPPSYREAVYVKDPWYRSEVALSMQHYGRICFSGFVELLRRYWPTSRFAQAGFFIVGLWIIVIVSGPTWDKSAHLGWGKNVDEFLSLIPPSPISGDGHYVSLADWSASTCQIYGLAAYCSRQMSYDLEIPHDANSLFTSDKIFVFVDPPRSAHLSDGRGKVPATVQVKMDGELKGKAKVDIQAYYEESLEPLLARAHVGLMKAGLRDQGVGIYTWPLPPNLVKVPKAIYPYPLLSFKVTVHVPASSTIPNMRIEGSDIDIAVFADLPKQDHKKHIHSPRFNIERSEALELPPASRGRLGFALGRRQASAKDDSANPHPLFGSLIAITRHGSVSLGGSIRTTGRLWIENSDGPIEIKPDTHLQAHEIHLESGRGLITIEKESLLESKDEVVIFARKGDVVAEEGVKVLGTRVHTDAGDGRLDSPKATWYSNHTMILSSTKGVEAAVGVSPPFLPELGTGTEQRGYVSVEATSKLGTVDLHFVEHVPRTALRVHADAPEGLLKLALNREYIGAYHVQGGAGSSVIPLKSDVDSTKKRRRVFSFVDESKSKAEYDAKGEMWWRADDAPASTLPDKLDHRWGYVEASAQGVARVSFEE